MSKVIMGFIIMVAATNTYAMDCKYLSEVAHRVMEVRQAGYPMADLVEAAEQDGALAKALVIEAYKRNQYSSNEYKENAANEFSNEVYMQCLEAQGN